jgi:outer membrane protein OmpA-like peptidoglycan-associated protein
MKQIIFLLIAAGCSASAIAQKINTSSHAASVSPGWALDLNMLGGMTSQSFTTANTMGNYPGAVSSNTGDLIRSEGYSYGANAQLGYFFGKGRNFGIGAGIMYMEQRADVILNHFRLDYKATDAAGNTFRQMLTGNDIREHVISTNVNVPIMLKYKARFSKHWGFSADGGALLNLQMKNAYTTHATFDQGAAYKFVQNADGGTTAVYDNAITPSAGDWLITKAEFLQNNPNGNWNEYARIKRSMGINVGDELITSGRSGEKAYKSGSVGFMIQPSINLYLSDYVTLNLGGYYMMQPFKNEPQGGYKLTDGNGSYSSVLNNVTSSVNQSYGVNFGARFFMGIRDRDHDGVADRKDMCPDVKGLAEFQGCPDTDKDGIQDSKDSCVDVFGLAQFNGCPDTDGDGIPDKLDECPLVAGPMELKGCPDKDKDGIADKYDQCPDVFGTALYHGCPDTDGDGVPDNEDNCPMVAGTPENHGCPVKPVIENHADGADGADMTTPILFEVNMAKVRQSSIPVIEDAVQELNDNKNATITIDGHADASGPDAQNKILSLQRAKSVKAELTDRGINPSRVKTVGHGSNDPAATNDTYEGKEQNRRAKMKLNTNR